VTNTGDYFIVSEFDATRVSANVGVHTRVPEKPGVTRFLFRIDTSLCLVTGTGYLGMADSSTRL
jgi:hypothetical protein